MKIQSPFLSFSFIVLMLTSSILFAQNNKEQRKEQRLLKRTQLTQYLSQPYFFVGFGLGGSIFVPASSTKFVSGVNGKKPWVENTNNAFPFFQGQLFLGYQIKRHFATIRFENLSLSYGREIKHINSNGYSGLESMTIIPYASLSYQYDVLNNNKKVSLQPGVHLGATFFDIRAKNYEEIQDGVMLRTISNGAPKAAFAFGPSLNFEINIHRWFSVNLYQQLTCVAGPVYKTHYFYQMPGENPVELISRTNFLNYSANISLRFKMYMKGTKRKVQELTK